MATPSATVPISFTRLKQIATDACESALGGAEYYEHSKTETWNTTIINSILRSVISESSPSGGGSPAFKYAVNSTIIQHLVPASALSKARTAVSAAGTSTTTAAGSTTAAAAAAEGGAATTTTASANNNNNGNGNVGRRGMHSATGAYWNEKTDGMWSFKYGGGESKGLDVVISVIWIAI